MIIALSDDSSASSQSLDVSVTGNLHIISDFEPWYMVSGSTEID